MLPINVVLPEIELAVQRRTEAPSLAELDAIQLRQLLYRIVDAYQRELGDPALYLERLVRQSGDMRTEIGEATERSVNARETVLRTMLEVLRPALPSLLGPVPAEASNCPGQHESRTDHPMLRGFELLDGRRRGPVGKGRYAISGRSWWIVALPPESNTDLVNARYAALDHGGEVDDHRGGHGHTYCDVRIVAIADAAAQIRHDDFDKVVASAIRRLRSVSSLQQRDLARRADEGAEVLQGALRALRRTP